MKGDGFEPPPVGAPARGDRAGDLRLQDFVTLRTISATYVFKGNVPQATSAWTSATHLLVPILIGCALSALAKSGPSSLRLWRREGGAFPRRALFGGFHRVRGYRAGRAPLSARPLISSPTACPWGARERACLPRARARDRERFPGTTVVMNGWYMDHKFVCVCRACANSCMEYCMVRAVLNPSL